MFAKVFWVVLAVLMISTAGWQIKHHQALQGNETAYGRALHAS
jgi:hypothetical protein